jgi:putative Ig domain-containing protein
MSPDPAQISTRLHPFISKTFPIHIILIFAGVLSIVSAGCAAPLEGFAAKDSAASSKSEQTHLTLSANFPAGAVGQQYNYVMSVSGGKAPYSFWISTGSLPAGLYLNPRTGTVWGTPQSNSTFNFTANVSDSQSGHGDKKSSIVINGQQQQVTVSVSPSAATVASGDTQNFAATVKGTSNTGVTWSASSGSVNTDGMFTAPQVTKSTAVTVTATSKADTQAHAAATVTVTPLAGITVSVTPTTASVSSGSTQQFNATVTGTSNTGVTWKASSGTLSGSGLFTAPQVQNNTTVTVTATSVADTNAHATATVTVTPLAGIKVSLTPTSASVAPSAQVQFTATVTGTSNTKVTWKAVSGTITQTGLYTAPSKAGSDTVTATSQADTTKFATASVTISTGPPPPPPAADNRYCTTSNQVQNFTGDGPAGPLQTCFYTGTDQTPSPGAQTHIKKGASLQSAINAAACGDTLLLDPTGDWSTVTLTRKNCPSTKWITIRADVSDAQLPPEGTRLTPCYAGLSSLPGRPAYSCSNPVRVIPTITLTASSDSIIASGDHYRLLGLEIRQSTSSALVYIGIDTRNGDHIIVDRCWIHGSATGEFNHALWINQSNYVALIDSYVTDAHCKSGNGACSDSQAIGGGTSTTNDATYKFVNNFLESSGEGFLFGGSSATTTPHDIEIRRNHFFKPMTWNPSDPSYFGTSFTVKNHFECKNCDAVLFEGNILENTWGGFSQVGAAILLTPKNPGNLPGQCPKCYTRNITIRYNKVINAAQAFQVANAAGDSGASAAGGSNYSIHDLLATGLNYKTCYQCGSYESQVSSLVNAPAQFWLHDVFLDHITMVPDQANTGWAGGFNTLGGGQMQNITWTNSIFDAGTYGPWSTGQGSNDCASAPQATSPLGKFNSCFSPYSFAGNVIPRGMKIQQQQVWPSNNAFPADVKSVGFVSLGTDYHLAPTSPYKGTGTDGKDPGADIDLLNAAITGVQ